MVQMRPTRLSRSSLGPACALLIATAMAMVVGITTAPAPASAPVSASSLDWQLDLAPGDLRLYVESVLQLGVAD